MTDFVDLTRDIDRFAAERNWERFHTPRNLALALTGEVGELAAELQWLTDAESSPRTLDPRVRSAVTDEIADVAIYLFRLCSVLEINLASAMRDKMARNAERFPADDADGSGVSKPDRD